MNTYMDKASYIKVDGNTIINEASIRWVKKMHECLEVCAKQSGCSVGVNTHRVCKHNSPDSYYKLNNYFDVYTDSGSN